MTKETKWKIKSHAYEGYRTEAVKRLTMMGVCPDENGVPHVEDSWEGVMKAIDYVKEHANKPGEFSGAVMAAAMWMHGYLEQDTVCQIKKAEELFAAESGENGETAREPAAATPASAVKM